MKRQTTAQAIGALIVLACVLLFVFFRLSEDSKKRSEQPKEQTELEKLMNYDMDENYPKTVRDVIKLYARYLKITYNEELSDEEIEALNKKMRQLYADKLNEYNDEKSQLLALKTEIATYREDKITMSGYIMSEASQIIYETINDIEYAKIYVTINMKVKASSASKSEEFVLEKDSEGRWKIYGWAIDTSSIEAGD